MLNSAAAQGYGTVSSYKESSAVGFKDTSNAVDRVLLLDEATTTVRGAIERIYSATAYLRNKADDVFGSRPSAPSASGGGLLNPTTRADGLRVAGGDLHQALTDLESEMQRFGAI